MTVIVDRWSHSEVRLGISFNVESLLRLREQSKTVWMMTGMLSLI